MKRSVKLISLPLLLLTSCGQGGQDYDATGVFETTEVVVSSEESGKLLQFDVEEGDSIVLGDQVALVDTMQLFLQKLQLDATMSVYEAQKPEIERQIAVTRQQLSQAEQERERYESLVREGAAGSKFLDDAENQVRLLQRQLDAQLSSLGTSTQSLNEQIKTSVVQKRQIVDRLQKCHVYSPLSGIVLEKYVEQGEFAAIGQPLFKIGDLTNVFLRAYVTSAQLKNIKLGQQVTVFADFGDEERREYEGRITWISEKSEFTPKTILTDDERADLVYAVKVAVTNDGYIKIGMYGEVKF